MYPSSRPSTYMSPDHGAAITALQASPAGSAACLRPFHRALRIPTFSRAAGRPFGRDRPVRGGVAIGMGASAALSPSTAMLGPHATRSRTSPSSSDRFTAARFGTIHARRWSLGHLVIPGSTVPGVGPDLPSVRLGPNLSDWRTAPAQIDRAPCPAPSAAATILNTISSVM
jgi:hypothetical protein